MTPLNELSFCVFDLETTGPNSSNDEIIEIGIVFIESLKISKKHHFSFNFKGKIPDYVQKLTKLNKEKLKSFPLFEEKAKEIQELIGDKILVAHNANFDVNFLNAQFEKNNIPKFTSPQICTQIMSQNLIPEILNTNLKYLSQMFKVNLDQAHSAIEDAEATANIFIKYLKHFMSRNLEKVNSLFYPKNQFEMDQEYFSKNHIEAGKKAIKSSPYPTLTTLFNENGKRISHLPTDRQEKSLQSTFLEIDRAAPSKLKVKFYGTYLQILWQHRNLLSKNKDLFYNGKNAEPQIILKSNQIIVFPHLIKGHFIAFSTHGSANSKPFLFRYPLHKKRFFIFLEKNLSEHSHQKLGAKHINLNYLNFFQNQLKKNEHSYFLIDKKTMKNVKFIKENLHRISEKGKFGPDFPTDYI